MKRFKTVPEMHACSGACLKAYYLEKNTLDKYKKIQALELYAQKRNIPYISDILEIGPEREIWWKPL